MSPTIADFISNSSSQSITSLVGQDAGVDIAIVTDYTQIINYLLWFLIYLKNEEKKELPRTKPSQSADRSTAMFSFMITIVVIANLLQLNQFLTQFCVSTFSIISATKLVRAPKW